jgi:hypothetical protein
MGIDLEKMKQKRNALLNKDPNREIFWKPQDGDTVIRIVATPDGDPFKEYWFHYNLGKTPGFLSPKKNFNESDPLDDFVRKLFNERSDDSLKMAKNLMARQRFFAPVVVRGEEEKGVQIWGFGKRAYQDLLDLVLNPDYGDITDPESGTDLKITYGKPPGQQFPVTTIVPRRRSSVLNEDDAVAAQWLDNIPEFAQVFDRKTPEEVGTLLDEYLSGNLDASADTDAATTKYSGDSASSVDKAFTELLSA